MKPLLTSSIKVSIRQYRTTKQYYNFQNHAFFLENNRYFPYFLLSQNMFLNCQKIDYFEPPNPIEVFNNESFVERQCKIMN